MQAMNMAGHNGIDLFRPQPNDVVAATDGVVTVSSNDPKGYGKRVDVLSPKMADGYYYQTIYGHFDEISVVFGQEVKAGDKLGVEGNTGFVISGGTAYWGTAPGNKGVHLHFGVKRLTDDLSASGLQVDIQVVGKIKKFVLLDYNNGVYGAIDPLPLLTDEVTPMLLKGKGGLVRNIKTGAYGTNLGDIILDAGTERTALQALDILSRLGHCVQLSDEEWNSVPHKDF